MRPFFEMTSVQRARDVDRIHGCCFFPASFHTSETLHREDTYIFKWDVRCSHSNDIYNRIIMLHLCADLIALANVHDMHRRKRMRKMPHQNFSVFVEFRSDATLRKYSSSVWIGYRQGGKRVALVERQVDSVKFQILATPKEAQNSNKSSWVPGSNILIQKLFCSNIFEVLKMVWFLKLILGIFLESQQFNYFKISSQTLVTIFHSPKTSFDKKDFWLILLLRILFICEIELICIKWVSTL